MTATRAGANPAGIGFARVSSTVRGAKQGHGARPGHDCRGSPPWLRAGVTFDLPRWHTQRSGRCPNSRYPHGERRLQPERRPRRSASRTPCTYLRHRRPANSPQRVPPALLDIHQIFTNSKTTHATPHADKRKAQQATGHEHRRAAAALLSHEEDKHGARSRSR